MEVPISKRTRSQCKKAEEELLKIARVLKAERDRKKEAAKKNPKSSPPIAGSHSRDENQNQKTRVVNQTMSPQEKADKQLTNDTRKMKKEKEKRKNGFKMSTKRPKKNGSLKDLSDEGESSSDMELIGEVFIPHAQRKVFHINNSRIAKLHRSIILEPIDTPASGPGRDTSGGSQNPEKQKEIGEPTRSSSYCTSSEDEDDFSYYKGSDLVLSSDEYDDNYIKGNTNQNLGRQEENPRIFYMISSSEEDSGESGDKDYKEDEPVRFGGEHQDWIYISDNDVDGKEKKAESMIFLLKANVIEETVGSKEDENRGGKRIMQNDAANDDCPSTLKEMDCSESGDKDYKGDGSLCFGGKHQDPIHISEYDLGGKKNKTEGNTSPVKTYLLEATAESKKDKDRSGKGIMYKDKDRSGKGIMYNDAANGDQPTLKGMDPITDNRNAENFCEGRKNRRVSGLSIADTKRDNNVKKNLLEPPCQVYQSSKEKLDLLNRGTSHYLPKEDSCESDDAFKEQFSPIQEEASAQNLLRLDRYEHENPATKDEWQNKIENAFAEPEMHQIEESTRLNKGSKILKDKLITIRGDNDPSLSAEYNRSRYHFRSALVMKGQKEVGHMFGELECTALKMKGCTKLSKGAEQYLVNFDKACVVDY